VLLLGCRRYPNEIGFFKKKYLRSHPVNPAPQRSNGPLIIFGVLLSASLAVIIAYVSLFLMTPAPTGSSVAPKNNPKIVDVLVAQQAIESGVPLTPSMFRKERVPSESLVPNTISNFDEIRGAFAASYIAARQPISSDFITMKAPVNQIQATIPEGSRAVSFAVDLTTSVEGWARSGAKVDVFLASAINNRPAITTIVQNAKVLSAGRNTTNEGVSQVASTVTIMVSVDEAAKIQLASSSGVLSLALRGDEDPVESPENVTVTIDSVVGVLPSQTPLAIPSEGKVVMDGRRFQIVNGRLVPDAALTNK
jgi:Flp pilus assembly protein CpaB